MEKLYVNKLNDSKYVALITVLDYEISVNKYLKQLSFEASSNKPEHVLVGKIELDTYKYVSVNTIYETLANIYLKDKKEIVLNSILTDSQINQLLN